jgi:hypothetical protein
VPHDPSATEGAVERSAHQRERLSLRRHFVGTGITPADDAKPATATEVATGGLNMDTVAKGWNWSARRALAFVLILAVAALIAGGFGGYLVRGASTLVVIHTVAVPVPAAATTSRPAYFGVGRSTAGYIPGL